MTIKEWCTYVNFWANKKGWWKPAKSALECHMMVVTELAEAVEQLRHKKHALYANWQGIEIISAKSIEEKGIKPEGEMVELADAVIRIMDYFGQRGWDLEEVMKLKMKYNETRPYRHGNLKY